MQRINSTLPSLQHQTLEKCSFLTAPRSLCKFTTKVTPRRAAKQTATFSRRNSGLSPGTVLFCFQTCGPASPTPAAKLSSVIKMKLIDSVVRSFKVAKVFRENTDKINAIDFSSNGEMLISCSEDDQIVLYDCEKGTQIRTVNSKKYGVDLIHFTHANNTAIHSSTKVDDTIRYLSLHDNKYLRYFPGHTKKVISLNISPVEDTFLSGSLDKTLRLWDLRSPNCQGVMHLNGRPVAAYDPEGLIFAAGVNSESIKLYDLRSFDKGPFVTFKLNQEKECDWTGLKFSRDGKTILISTNGSIIRLIDAFHGTPLQTFTGEQSPLIVLESSSNPEFRSLFQATSTTRASRSRPRSVRTRSLSSRAVRMGGCTCGTPTRVTRFAC